MKTHTAFCSAVIASHYVTVHYITLPAYCRCNPTAISLKAGCELFLRYTTRTSALELEDFTAAKRRLIEVIVYIHQKITLLLIIL
jgi:hypothetical protein